MDAQQDWILEAGEEENGYTVLAFRRDWVTCDEQDREINVCLLLQHNYVEIYTIRDLFNCVYA